MPASSTTRSLHQPFSVAILCLLIDLNTRRALADTWCSTNFSGAVFCDDFDGYADFDAFIDAWEPTGDASGFCSSFLLLDTDAYSSPPYAAKMNTQENGDLGYSVNVISAEIRNAFSPTYSAVIGSDLSPLVLEFVLNGQDFSKATFDNSFLTLGSGLAHAPTDWAYSDWCSCTSPLTRWPVICQQEAPTALCPPIGAALDVPAIAAGFLAYLDSNPCHCSESGTHSPYNQHLSFFDGHKWYKLRQGLFAGTGDFRVRNKENRIKVTIKTSSLKIEMTTPDTGEYSSCEIPGGYPGPFNTLAAGFHKSCQLKTGVWECRDDPSCRGAVGVPGGAVPRYDNIVVHGGAGYAPPGACCYADTHCDEAVPPGDCQTLGGQFAGSGTTCANTACCPPQPGDHDLDTDVDMADFGWFQRCLTGTNVQLSNVPCRCVDFDNDGDVDGADVLTFAKCMRGPDIPATPNCLN